MAPSQRNTHTNTHNIHVRRVKQAHIHTGSSYGHETHFKSKVSKHAKAEQLQQR